MATANEAVVMRWFDEFWSKQDAGLLEELHTPDFVDHDPALGPLEAGLDSWAEAYRAYINAFPDVAVRVDRLLSLGDDVVAAWTFTGTHQGEVLGVTATGRRVDFAGISILRLADGKIASQTVVWDALGLMRQLGAVPG